MVEEFDQLLEKFDYDVMELTNTDYNDSFWSL